MTRLIRTACYLRPIQIVDRVRRRLYSPPPDLSPPRRYLARDVVQHPLTLDADGDVVYDDRPVTPDEAVLERFSVQHIVLRKD